MVCDDAVPRFAYVIDVVGQGKDRQRGDQGESHTVADRVGKYAEHKIEHRHRDHQRLTRQLMCMSGNGVLAREFLIQWVIPER